MKGLISHLFLLMQILAFYSYESPFIHIKALLFLLKPFILIKALLFLC